MADIKGWVKGSWVLSVHLVSNEVRAEAANPIIRPPLSLSPSLLQRYIFLSLPLYLSIYLLSIYPSRSRYVDAAVPFISFCSNSVESTESVLSLHLSFLYFLFYLDFLLFPARRGKLKRNNSYKANIITTALIYRDIKSIKATKDEI